MPNPLISKSSSPTQLAVLMAAGVLFTSACDGLGSGDQTLLHVYSAHHATPEDGVYPDRGAEDMPRTFQTDAGWEVTLTESYITTSAVTLVSCDGTSYPLEMFWGPCPENMHDQDLEALTVAGRELPVGSYCKLQVEYAPFSPDASEEGNGMTHQLGEAEMVRGTTVYLRGGARQGSGEYIPFELQSDRTIRVQLDISTIDEGGPLKMRAKQNFPKELTVAKTYDRFFDGIDFAAFDAATLEGRLEAEIPRILIEQTRAVTGTAITSAPPQP